MGETIQKQPNPRQRKLGKPKLGEFGDEIVSNFFPIKTKKLTKKQRGFVNDYVKTGNGTFAVLNNYDIEGKNPEKIASALAVENLGKPSIEIAIKSISEKIPDELLVERHLELLNKRDGFNVTEKILDENGKEKEIIKFIDSGPETNAVKAGLEMAYKIKKLYGEEEKPKEKSTNVYNFFFSKEIQEKVGQLESDIKERLKQKNVQET